MITWLRDKLRGYTEDEWISAMEKIQDAQPGAWVMMTKGELKATMSCRDVTRSSPTVTQAAAIKKIP